MQTLAGTLARLTQSDFGSVEYSGLELIKYYLNLLENNFSGYPWQIVTSYTIAMTCIIMLVVLFMLFLFRVWRHQRRKKKEKEIYEYYSDKFHLILGSAETLTHEEILEMLGQTEDDIRKNDTYYYANILEEARMALYEIVCLPNMQTLATSLGVVDRFTFQLLKHKDVFRTLQMLLMLQITVNEGLLANFVNHTNREIRMMARLNYITCSRNIPYRYLITELNEEQSLYRPMILNYVFGWMMFQERLMPNFLNLADRVTNEDSAAFLVRRGGILGKRKRERGGEELLPRRKTKGKVRRHRSGGDARRCQRGGKISGILLHAARAHKAGSAASAAVAQLRQADRVLQEGIRDKLVKRNARRGTAMPVPIWQLRQTTV